MGTIGIIVLGLFIFILIFLLLREVNMWYWKINKRISLMQEQNDLLSKLISQSDSQEKVVSNNMSEKPTVETITYKAPKIVKQSTSNENSLMKGSYENIHLEFADGVKGSIFHNQTKKEYYFIGKSRWSKMSYYYDNFENCANAFHHFETTKQILEIGFVGLFS